MLFPVSFLLLFFIVFFYPILPIAEKTPKNIIKLSVFNRDIKVKSNCALGVNSKESLVWFKDLRH